MVLLEKGPTYYSVQNICHEEITTTNRFGKQLFPWPIRISTLFEIQAR